MARILATRASMSAREFAKAGSMGESKARRVLRGLVESGAARSFRAGRATRFFARGSGARPDLGLDSTVAVIQAEVDEERAQRVGDQVRRSSFLGLVGEDEDLDSLALLYRPVFQVVFEETVQRTGLERLLGPSEERLVGTVYLHASTLQILRFTRKDGISFLDQPGPYASRVDDFDGTARFADVAPGRITIDEDMWRARRGARHVLAAFRERFAAEPASVTPYFVPIWRLLLGRRGTGNFRVVTIDGIVGRPVEWPGGSLPSSG